MAEPPRPAEASRKAAPSRPAESIRKGGSVGSPEVERLWQSYHRSPTDEARNRLVEAYQPLVRQVVRRFAHRLPRSVDRGDLETAANVGLIAAVEGFDPERGVRFESYCELRAKGALLDELRSQDWLPRPWRQKVEQRKRISERLRAERGREPSDEEVAEAMGLSIGTYREHFSTSVSAPPSSYHQGEEDSGNAVLDGLPDSRGEGPDERLTREELLRLVTQRLTDLEYQVVYLKYWEELPMREIGELTQLSESRVCKVHTRLMERLRDRLRVER